MEELGILQFSKYLFQLPLKIHSEFCKTVTSIFKEIENATYDSRGVWTSGFNSEIYSCHLKFIF